MQTEVSIEPGPELDRAVAEAIGYSPAILHGPCGEVPVFARDGELPLQDFRPSTDLNAAFVAAEKVGLWKEYGYCQASGQHVISRTVPVATWSDSISHNPESAALAICEATLRLKEVSDGNG
jgi:hypothetical protein